MKKIRSALISVFYKEGLEQVVKTLSALDITIYSTGGTQEHIEKLGVNVVPVDQLTHYPSILGGRVKTLHPAIFGAILGKRDDDTHRAEMKEYNIPEIDLVIVDLYPFEETVAKTKMDDRVEAEKAIIEKIDIGGPSMIRAAAKNFNDVLVVAAKKDYAELQKLLEEQKGETSRDQRKSFAAKAFQVVAHYDVAISKYFNPGSSEYFLESIPSPRSLRYGENPHQPGIYYGNLEELFEQLHGKELSYNNLVDIDAAIQLINEFRSSAQPGNSASAVFIIIKHTNVCGAAERETVAESWESALAGDPESAFGGVLACNNKIDRVAAEEISEIFFEVLIAPSFDEDALAILKTKKNRILLRHKVQGTSAKHPGLPSSIGSTRDKMFRSLLNGVLVQDVDEGNYTEWKEVGGRDSSPEEKEDLVFANIICKHLKSNAIALVKNKQLLGKGCGQTSRIDSLRQAIEKARQFGAGLEGAVMASDAFFPFNDCVVMGREAGITAFIQPGGSIRDNDSIEYCKTNKLAMVLTGMRHFRH